MPGFKLGPGLERGLRRGPKLRLKLGLGVATYNRAGRLATTLDSVAAMTATPHVLVVADDGSRDDTRAMLRARGVACVAGENRGVAWNKNRLLYILGEVERCDVLILLEDDTFPLARGWEEPWIEAVARHGHVNYAGPWFAPHIRSGAGTPEDPFRSPYTSGQCSAFGRAALRAVGYMDTRFKAYGYEHGEHTERFVRAGFGGDPATAEIFLIASDLCVTEMDAHHDGDAQAANGEVYLRLRAERGIYRGAWRDAAERRALGAEMRGATLPGATLPGAGLAGAGLAGAAARLRRLVRASAPAMAGTGWLRHAAAARAARAARGFDEAAYLGANPDVAAAVAHGALPSGAAHYRAHGRAERRPLGPDGEAR